MSTSHDFQLGIFYPDQLDVLNRAVEKACRWHGLKEEGLDADDLAGHALSLYSSGITDEDALFKRLRRMPLTKRARHTRNVSDFVRLDRRHES